MTVITENSIGPGERIFDDAAPIILPPPVSRFEDDWSVFTITAGVSLISTDVAALHLGKSFVQNSGRLVGAWAITADFEIHLINEVGGSLQAWNSAVFADRQEIVNYGEISSFGAGLLGRIGAVSNHGSISLLSNVPDAAAVWYGESGIIRNFGTIEGPIGIQLNGGNGDNNVYNAGILRAQVAFRDKQSSPASGDYTDVFYNTGTIVADTAFEGQAPVSIMFTNAGSITGNIFFANAPDGLVSHATTIFDSSLGEVFGTISTVLNGVSAAASTIVGGTNGGTMVGGDGNDVFIANQGPRAAEFAVHATLSGGGGTNALYGGGAFNTFLAGTSHGGFSQIWGGTSTMAGVAGYTNNTLSFAGATSGMFVDLLNGHNAYVGATAGEDWSGTGRLEDAIANVPNVVGSRYGDVIQADNGIDRITGGRGGDQLYAGNGASSHDTFIYTAYADSDLNFGYDTIVNFKLATDRIDVSALHSDASHLVVQSAGFQSYVYLEHTAGTFDLNTDLAVLVVTTTNAAVTSANFIF